MKEAGETGKRGGRKKEIPIPAIQISILSLSPSLHTFFFTSAKVVGSWNRIIVVVNHSCCCPKTCFSFAYPPRAKSSSPLSQILLLSLVFRTESRWTSRPREEATTSSPPPPSPWATWPRRRTQGTTWQVLEVLMSCKSHHLARQSSQGRRREDHTRGLFVYRMNDWWNK